MRILHVIYDDIGNPWLGGGGATRTLEIYSRIVERGHAVVVVCGRYRGAATRETRRGVRYRRVGVSRYGYLMSRLSFVAEAARLIKRGGYDIVIEDVSPFSPVASPLWKPRDIRAVASVQNLSGAHATAKYGLPGWGPRLVEKPLLSLFTNFVAVSPGIADQLHAMLGQNVRVGVVPNSIDRRFFEAPGGDPPGWLPARYLLSLGRIDVYQKGLDTLIQAFDLLADREPGVDLVIVGGGTTAQMTRLRHLRDAAHHHERIHLAGPVEAEEAARLMRGALLFAMPSRYEAWPLTALEAGAAAIPVVGTDVTGVRDAAPPYPKGHGILSPAGRVGEFAETLQRVLGDETLRSDAGARGREWARRFTWDALAEEQLAFYTDIVNEHGLANSDREQTEKERDSGLRL